MRKVLKWIGIILGGLVGLLIVAGVVLYFIGYSKLNKTRQIQPVTITIPGDEAALARGEHLVDVTCTSCHGADLRGDILLDDPVIGTIYSANITGLADQRSDEELLVAIRHAIGPGGRQIIAMPSDAFIYYSAEDLGAIIAYLKTIPRNEKESLAPDLSIPGYIMLGAGMFGDLSTAEVINHEQQFSQMPEVGANEAYGAYLSHLCTTCHGQDLSGAQPSVPGSPIAPNLTPGGGLASWSEADFIQAMRSGVTPSGHQLDPEFMPWKSWAKFHDEELQAIWMYLSSLPARQMAIE